MTTVTDALRHALDPATDPATRTTLLCQLSTRRNAMVAASNPYMVAIVLRYGLGQSGLSQLTACWCERSLLSAGIDNDDLVTVLRGAKSVQPRSADWVRSAERIAKWADGEVTV